MHETSGNFAVGNRLGSCVRRLWNELTGYSKKEGDRVTIH